MDLRHFCFGETICPCQLSKFVSLIFGTIPIFTFRTSLSTSHNKFLTFSAINSQGNVFYEYVQKMCKLQIKDEAQSSDKRIDPVAYMLSI